jgi:hypothetical protein
MDMNWDKVKNVVSGIAPLIGSAFGPAGTAVGALVAAALGVDNSPEQVLEAIKTDPEAALKLRALELEHKYDFERLQLADALEHRKVDTADIQDARKRDTAITEKGYHNYRADVLAALAFISLIAMVYMINVNDIMKPEVLAIFNMSIGAVLKMIGDVFAFEFGSSRGSKEKDLDK